MKKLYLLLLAIGLTAAGVAPAHEATEARAHYLGNEGVMLERGDTKIVFDPLFSRDYDHYRLVPDNIKQALLDGTPPYDGMDAVFVSHYHEDHYDPRQMLDYLQRHEALQFYAPEQAVAGLRELPGAAAIMNRVHSVSLKYGDEPIQIEVDRLLIEAVRIPHAGWPEARTDVENIVFRVTLDGTTTVSHLGDADADTVHFDTAWWSMRRSQLALPPYWFMAYEERLETLVPVLNAEHVIGIHVPQDMPHEPADRPEEYRSVDLFTRPGESRDVAEGKAVSSPGTR